MSKPKLTPEDVAEMQRLRDSGITSKELAERYGVSESTVSIKTKPKEPKQECSTWGAHNKASWPEWILWDNMHKRYGKRAEA